MIELHVLRVFTGADGDHGNPLGVVADGRVVPTTVRQAVATELGFSETVFVDDPSTGSIRLYTPGGELAFAGHPLVGTAWLLRQLGHPVSRLAPPAGRVPSWREDDLCWVRGEPGWCPRWTIHRLPSRADVEAATGPPNGYDAVQLWAFIDEGRGSVRARVFAPRFGVVEDEACGSASMLLCAELQRPLTIHHGVGSEIFVRLGPRETVDIGGRVVHAELRDLTETLAQIGTESVASASTIRPAR
jgi:predicted PhzF superfamily epimerase YddE/YHI9